MMRFVHITLGALVLALSAGTSAFAGTSNNLMRVVIDQGGNGPVSKSIVLGLNKAAIVELPKDTVDVLVSNPSIADAVIRTPRRVFVIGMAGGETNAFFFDRRGEQILNLEIRVERDVASVQSAIERLVPSALVEVEALNNNIVVSGRVGSASEADQVVRIAQRFAGAPENVVNMLEVTGKEQVLLKVRIVEMQRSVTKQLGINLASAMQLTDELSFNVETENAFSLIGRSLGGFAGDFDYTNTGGGDISGVEGTVQALERVGLVRTLAEPNLTAITGEPAQFLAGGEFPVPVGRDNTGQVLVEYKPFGVGLSFTPMVLSEGRISMFVSTEVSELTNQGAIDLNGGAVDSDGDGIVDTSVPGQTLLGLKVRRAETTVEIPSGASLVIAGLIQDNTSQSVDGSPGLKDIPGLGALFRARDFQTAETELVVVVTPYLVDPVERDQVVTPADGFATPSDLHSVIFGSLNAVYGRGSSQSPADAPKRKRHFWRGPIGFALQES